MVEEWDILRGDQYDLSDAAVVAQLRKRILSQEFQYIFMSPPCSTWSRALFSNSWGPRPLRNKQWPRGFPWLEGRLAALAQTGNLLVDFCFTICLAICQAGITGFVKVIWEHPEDLGASKDSRGRVCYPASIWQLEEFVTLLSFPGWFSVAFFQCQFQVDRLKPTRLLSNLEGIQNFGSLGPPSFDENGFYAGPLPATCPHGGHPPLIKQSAEQPFPTTGTGVYPPAMDLALAQTILHHFLANPSLKGVKRMYPEQGVTPEAEQGVTPQAGKGVTPQGGELQTEGEWSHGETEAAEWEGPKGQEEGAGIKVPMRAFYKGRSRPVHDGLGLCSPGRMRSADREISGGRRLVALRRVFWDTLNGWLDKMGKKEELALMAKVLCGKVEESPFGEISPVIRGEWVSLLREEGLDGSRRAGDRDSAIELRLLQALGSAVGDPDVEYLEEMASVGVRLGAGDEIDRIPAVYEEKTSWRLPDPAPGKWDEESLRDNYRSAGLHLGKVEEQIDKDVKAGHIIAMPLEEARRRYGTDLKVASLAAVPKDVEWEQVRVVHDASNGVEVNHQIRLNNRMRFPLFDDLEAVLWQFMKEADSRKLAMAYDFKGAHRLVPVHPKDWGKQAFRLGDEGTVYVNCVGTFGVASAAFWWSRLAGSLQRVMWAILPAKDPLYSLLYADDGLCAVSGPRYRRILLGVLLFLTVLGAPLSWPKTRGGLQLEWLGYYLDLKQGKVGVSVKKVEWLENWIGRVLKAGGVLGRDLKSALGRMGFLAGPLKHARPFLAPVYRWASKVQMGSFVPLPAAIDLTFGFFLEAVRGCPMRVPRGPPKPGGEIFRVDAKADQALVSIGGWESFGGKGPGEARWFSVELNRKNAPWIFVKGEPFKVIASLELLAITVAVMVFSEGAVWKGSAGRLVLTAYTDNQGNSYVLDKHMTTAFPLSIILMELSAQLQALEVDLDLQWVPREQNVAADALTNQEFQEFNPEKRVKVELEDLEFKILPVLMKRAAELDQEVVLKKTSKEKATHHDLSKKMRLTEPW